MITLALIALVALVALYLFFGWIIRAIIFCGFGFLAHWYLWDNVVATRQIAFTFGAGTTISWAAVIPAVICILTLAVTRE